MASSSSNSKATTTSPPGTGGRSSSTASSPGAAISRDDKQRQLNREALMDRIRARPHRSYQELARHMRMSMLERRYALDVVEKANLQRALDSLQHCVKARTRAALVERLESLSRQLGLKFMEDPAGLFISTDMFFLEILLDAGGQLTDVKVHHEGRVGQQSCAELVECLKRGDFADFTEQLEGLSSIYQLNAEPNVKMKAFNAMQAIERDLQAMYEVASSSTECVDASSLLRHSPVGIVTERRGGHPMRLSFFVSPYDLIEVAANAVRPLTVERVQREPIGWSATVNLEASSTHQLEILPTVTFDGAEGRPLYAPLTAENSMLLPATFVLRLSRPLPVGEHTLQALGLAGDAVGAPPLDSRGCNSFMQLIVYAAGEQKVSLSSKHGLFVCLPDQTHCYFLTDDASVKGSLLTSVPFTEPSQVPVLLQHLKQEALFYTLLASCVRPKSKMSDMESLIILELECRLSESISVTLQHPHDDTLATIEFELRDNSVYCMLYNYEDLNEKLTLVAQKSLSIPVTMRACLQLWQQKHKQQLQQQLTATSDYGGGSQLSGLAQMGQQQLSGTASTMMTATGQSATAGGMSTSAAAYGNFQLLMSPNETLGRTDSGSGHIGGGATYPSALGGATMDTAMGGGYLQRFPRGAEDFHESPKSQLEAATAVATTSSAAAAAAATSLMPTMVQMQQSLLQQQQQLRDTSSSLGQFFSQPQPLQATTSLQQQHQQSATLLELQQQIQAAMQATSGQASTVTSSSYYPFDSSEIADKYKNIWKEKATKHGSGISCTAVHPETVSLTRDSLSQTSQEAAGQQRPAASQMVPLAADGQPTFNPAVVSTVSAGVPALSPGGVVGVTHTPFMEAASTKDKLASLLAASSAASSSPVSGLLAAWDCATGPTAGSKRPLETPQSSDAFQKEKKRKKRRDDSPMGPPDKVYSRQNSPASTVGDSGVMLAGRKFPSPSSSPKGASGGGFGNNSSIGGLSTFTAWPSPKHSPVYSSPKHTNTASNSPKSPFGMHSPKHGSSGKPSMSTLKSATAATSATSKAGDKSTAVTGLPVAGMASTSSAVFGTGPVGQGQAMGRPLSTAGSVSYSPSPLGMSTGATLSDAGNGNKLKEKTQLSNIGDSVQGSLGVGGPLKPLGGPATASPPAATASLPAVSALQLSQAKGPGSVSVDLGGSGSVGDRARGLVDPDVYIFDAAAEAEASCGVFEGRAASLTTPSAGSSASGSQLQQQLKQTGATSSSLFSAGTHQLQAGHLLQQQTTQHQQLQLPSASSLQQLLQQSPPFGGNSTIKNTTSEPPVDTSSQKEETSTSSSASCVATTDYVIKTSQEGLKLTINKTSSIRQHATNVLKASASGAPAAASVATAAPVASTASLSAPAAATIKKQHTGLKPGVNSGPASKKSSALQAASTSGGGSMTPAATLGAADATKSGSQSTKHVFQKANSSGNLSAKLSSGGLPLASSANAAGNLQRGGGGGSPASFGGDLRGSRAGGSNNAGGGGASRKASYPPGGFAASSSSATMSQGRIDHNAERLRILQYACPTISSSLEGFRKTLQGKFQIPKLSQRLAATTSTVTSTLSAVATSTAVATSSSDATPNATSTTLATPSPVATPNAVATPNVVATSSTSTLNTVATPSTSLLSTVATPSTSLLSTLTTPSPSPLATPSTSPMTAVATPAPKPLLPDPSGFTKQQTSSESTTPTTVSPSATTTMAQFFNVPPIVATPEVASSAEETTAEPQAGLLKSLPRSPPPPYHIAVAASGSGGKTGGIIPPPPPPPPPPVSLQPSTVTPMPQLQTTMAAITLTNPSTVESTPVSVANLPQTTAHVLGGVATEANGATQPQPPQVQVQQHEQPQQHLQAQQLQTQQQSQLQQQNSEAQQQQTQAQQQAQQQQTQALQQQSQPQQQQSQPQQQQSQAQQQQLEAQQQQSQAQQQEMQMQQQQTQLQQQMLALKLPSASPTSLTMVGDAITPSLATGPTLATSIGGNALDGQAQLQQLQQQPVNILTTTTTPTIGAAGGSGLSAGGVVATDPPPATVTAPVDAT